MIGARIDERYEVLSLLGQGGMGAVYRARHVGTGKLVALKVILSADLSKHHDVVARFQREARAAGAIDTQHIVQVIDSGIDRAQGFPYMVMELLKGEDVQQLVQRVGPLPADLALRIAGQACVGLQKAHDAGVVHRDIKPANLFLSSREGGEVVVKLLDFGIAKVKMDELSSAEGHALTRTGSLLGSPLYMSPEQAKGLKTIDKSTDVWSLGAVLYEVLTGRTPHHKADTLGQLILAICSEPPPPIQDLAPWVPADVAAIVARALTIDPARRFPSARAMLDAIEPLLPHGIGLREEMLVALSDDAKRVVAPRHAAASDTDAWAPTLGIDQAVTGTTGQGGLARSGVDTRASRPRSPAGAIAGGLIAVAAVAGGLWAVSRGPQAGASASPRATASDVVPSSVVASGSAEVSVTPVVIASASAGAPPSASAASAASAEGAPRTQVEPGASRRAAPAAQPPAQRAAAASPPPAPAAPPPKPKSGLDRDFDK